MSTTVFKFDDKKLRIGFVNIAKANFIASKNTLDTMAGLTRKNAIKNISSNFIERSTFTKRQIQFEKSSGTKLSDLESRAGATARASYLKLQEIGGDRKTKGGKNLAIPTNEARGGSASRLVSRSHYLEFIKKRKIKGKFKKNFKSKKARSVASAFVAFREKKFLSRSGGIYNVSSFRKSGKNKVKYKKHMLYNTKEKKVIVKSVKWLEPATKKPINDAQAIYNSQINKLLRKDII